MKPLQAIEDVPLSLQAELGRKNILFAELLDLRVGAVVPLSRPAGENVDLYASDAYVGSGEILVMDGILSVRLADIGEDPASAPDKLLLNS